MIVETCAALDARDPTADRGLHDPRLWSNLRGALTGESTAERIAVHARLSCSETASIRDAYVEGFWRGQPPAPLFLAFVFFLAGFFTAHAIRTWSRLT